MDSFSVRDARNNLYRLVDEVAEHHKPITISGKRNEAILLSREDWEAIQETIYLTSIPGMAESLHQAASEPIEDCVQLEDVDW